MITLPVDAVKRATSPIEYTTTPKEAIESQLKTSVEACSEFTGEVVSCWHHPFVNACHKAYS